MCLATLQSTNLLFFLHNCHFSEEKHCQGVNEPRPLSEVLTEDPPWRVDWQLHDSVDRTGRQTF